MATSSSALALTRTRNGHRRRLIVVGGVLIAAAAIVVASLVALNLAGARTVPFDVDHAPIIQEQLHQHLLRENAAAPETQPARGNASTMLYEHLLRENAAAPETQPARGNASTMLHQHLLRENGSSL